MMPYNTSQSCKIHGRGRIGSVELLVTSSYTVTQSRQKCEHNAQLGNCYFVSTVIEPLLLLTFSQPAARCRAFVRNMDTEAVERSIQEATASVRENVLTLERALLDIEEHTRYVSLLQHTSGLKLQPMIF